MKKCFRIAAIMYAIATLVACSSTNDTTGDWPVPEHKLCEMDYTPAKTTFSLWAPTADEVEVRLYDNGTLAESIAMKPAEACMWTATKEGDQIGKQYTFRVKVDGEWLKETPGIFARAVTTNGERGESSTSTLPTPRVGPRISAPHSRLPTRFRFTRCTTAI